MTGRVIVSSALAAKVAHTDTVFVFARAGQGPRMPLAILRRSADELRDRWEWCVDADGSRRLLRRGSDDDESDENTFFLRRCGARSSLSEDAVRVKAVVTDVPAVVVVAVAVVVVPAPFRFGDCFRFGAVVMRRQDSSELLLEPPDRDRVDLESDTDRELARRTDFLAGTAFLSTSLDRPSSDDDLDDPRL